MAGGPPATTPVGWRGGRRGFSGTPRPRSPGRSPTTFTFFNNWRLSAMLDAASGFKRLDNNIRIRCQLFHTCMEYVQPQNTDPRLLAQYFSGGTLRDFTINDAGYVKFRELSLAYDVPSRYSARFGAHGATLAASVRNLGMWTSYTGIDPESQFVAGGPTQVDQAELPQLLTWAFTVRLNY